MNTNFVYFQFQRDMNFLSALIRMHSVSTPKHIIRSFSRTVNDSLDHHTTVVRNAYARAVQSALPHTLIQNYVQRQGSTLVIGGTRYNLNKNVYVVGFGKAVVNMVRPIEKLLKEGDDSSHIVSGVISVPVGIRDQITDSQMLPDESSRMVVMEGAMNNIPDEDAHRAAVRVLETVRSAGKDDLVIVLISGGGSALLPMPITPITMSEKGILVRQLSEAGADIVELNTVRKAISNVKGGKLALNCKARMTSLILSDVINNPLDIIASGPLMRCSDKTGDALAILRKYNLGIPDSVIEVFNKQTDTSDSDFAHVSNHIIGDNMLALEAAKEYITSHGPASIRTLVLTSTLCGDANDVAVNLSRACHAIVKAYTTGRLPRDALDNLSVYDEESAFEMIQAAIGEGSPLCLLFGGETTVRLPGECDGVGGRNQHLVLQTGYQIDNVSYN